MLCSNSIRYAMPWFKFVYTNILIGGHIVSFDLDVIESEDLLSSGWLGLQRELSHRYASSREKPLRAALIDLCSRTDNTTYDNLDDFQLMDIAYPLENVKRTFDLVHIYVTSDCEACRFGCLGQLPHMREGGCLYESQKV